MIEINLIRGSLTQQHWGNFRIEQVVDWKVLRQLADLGMTGLDIAFLNHFLLLPIIRRAGRFLETSSLLTVVTQSREKPGQSRLKTVPTACAYLTSVTKADTASFRRACCSNQTTYLASDS